jgi:hypothetical protein
LGNIRNKQELIWKHLGFPAPTFGTMSLMTIENLMCEASKYISLTRDPKTKGRQRYRQRPRVEQVATIVAAFRHARVGTDNKEAAVQGQSQFDPCPHRPFEKVATYVPSTAEAEAQDVLSKLETQKVGYNSNNV